jgi:hypothetical protein
MRTKVCSYALGNFVLIRVYLPDDGQIPRCARGINSMESGIEGYAVGPPADFQEGNDLMLFQIKYHELGIAGANREQAAILGIDGHPSWLVARCERPFTHKGSLEVKSIAAMVSVSTKFW